jgi:hypothetical protein
MAATTTTKRHHQNAIKVKDTKTTTTITNKKTDENVTVSSEEIRRAKEKILVEDHLPPLGLAFVVLVCSGFLLVLNLRDFATTGKNLLGEWDESLLVRTVMTIFSFFSILFSTLLSTRCSSSTLL